MKEILILGLLLAHSCLFAQETLTKVINHDGEDRGYIIYIPATYTVGDEVPLILNFHGYGSNALDQMRYGDFRPVADTAGFIIVHPQGAIFEGITHWNVGSWVAGSPYDDVSFAEAIIDEVSAAYSIDSKRIYSTGMSNGGYMSFLLACQLSDRIAAVASVTGSMTPNNLLDCDPQRPLPVMQIHGTNDGTVPYQGAVWTEPVADVIDYWVEHNDCTIDPITGELPDVNTADGSTASFFRYAGGEQGSVVEHVRINGGDHTWPGTVFVTPGTNLDFLASDAIWQFFSRYSLDGFVTSTTETEDDSSDLAVHYDSGTAALYLFGVNQESKSYAITASTGTCLYRGDLDGSYASIPTVYLSRGVYVLTIDAKQSVTFVVNR